MGTEGNASASLEIAICSFSPPRNYWSFLILASIILSTFFGEFNFAAFITRNIIDIALIGSILSRMSAAQLGHSASNWIYSGLELGLSGTLVVWPVVFIASDLANWLCRLKRRQIV